MIKNLFLAVSLVVLLVAACNNEKTMPEPTFDPGVIYYDYKVWGNEENSDLTVRLQYFIGEEGGKTVSWEGTGSVEFDGVILQPDSSKMNGFYYETIIPVENFVGKHSIVLTDSNRKQYKEEFEFSPFSLKNEIPRVISRKEFKIGLNGLDSGETVRLLLNDTAFYSRGIDRMDTLRNDSIIITPRDMENLKNGPIYLEIYKEGDWPLKQPGQGGGRISVSYGLKRVFELKD
jgi:hypothetical protein